MFVAQDRRRYNAATGRGRRGAALGPGFDMMRQVIVLGGGTAGLLTALALKVKLPQLEVTLLRSKDLGVIGVGEGSMPDLPDFLHRYLGIELPEFYRGAVPTPKLGLRLLWGPRPSFYFAFGSNVLERPEGLARPLGYYCEDDMENLSPAAALMAVNRAFPRAEDGSLVIVEEMAYHIDNERLVDFLETYAARAGVDLRDEIVRSVETSEAGVAALVTESGARYEADLYVDSSGFRSLLIEQALGEPLLSYRATLFCDCAVVGAWDRAPGEVIRPYTTAETMDAGWCWQVEHEERVARGYVYSSDFLTADAAEAEFRAKNPNVRATRVVRFVSGRRRNAWVGNVVAVGNAGGFVEPLEATSLFVIAHDARRLADVLAATELAPRPAVRAYNLRAAGSWDAIRDFLAVHYRFNTRLDTPFWKACRADVALCGATDLVAYYADEGPSPWGRHVLRQTQGESGFTVDAYYTILLGQRVPYRQVHPATEVERRRLGELRAAHRLAAMAAFDSRGALQAFRDPAAPRG
jgi:tryptophan halogenase